MKQIRTRKLSLKIRKVQMHHMITLTCFSVNCPFLEIYNERKCHAELSVLSVKLPRFRGPKALTASDGKSPLNTLNH